MSDISDILTKLAATAAAVLYPNGTGDDENAPSPVTNTPVIIYAGWPTSDLEQDLAGGKTHVSVFAKAEERNTTRYSEKSHVITAPAPTLTLTMGYYSPGAITLEGGSGNIGLEGGGSLMEEYSPSVSVGGSVSVPQNVMLKVNGKDYVYAVQGTDTLTSIAAALAALVAVNIAGTVAIGSEVIIGSGARLQAARVGGFGTIARETKRQEKVAMVTVWAASPGLRDQIAAAIDSALSCIKFLAMPDGFGARLIYKNTLVVDALQKATLYRRDLNYTVEFPTTAKKSVAAVIAPKLRIRTGQVNPGAMQLEGGGELLTEDGSPLLLESSNNETRINY